VPWRSQQVYWSGRHGITDGVGTTEDGIRSGYISRYGLFGRALVRIGGVPALGGQAVPVPVLAVPALVRVVPVLDPIALEAQQIVPARGLIDLVADLIARLQRPGGQINRLAPTRTGAPVKMVVHRVRGRRGRLSAIRLVPRRASVLNSGHRSSSEHERSNSSEHGPNSSSEHERSNSSAIGLSNSETGHNSSGTVPNKVDSDVD
jgi:hypothetical protein